MTSSTSNKRYTIPSHKALGFDPDALRAKYKHERERRLRKVALSPYLQVNNDNDFKHYLDDPYVEKIEREPIVEDVNVLIVGAGFGGMLAAASLRKLDVGNIRIIEKGGDFGGTWYWNRYPGVACDIESYIYLPLLEDVGYVPKERYSHGPEIFEYSQRFARHFDLYKDAYFQTEVSEARWDEGRRRWVVTTHRGDRISARFLNISAGPLGRPKLPGIPGIETYEGHTFHTCRWDYRYTGGSPTVSSGVPGPTLNKLKDKRVAIIGTGATAIQAIPHLGHSAKELYVIQRTPSSVELRENAPTDPAWAASLKPGWQKARALNFEQITSGVWVEEDLVNDGLTRAAYGDFRDFLQKIGLSPSALGTLPPDELWTIAELSNFTTMERVRGFIGQMVKNEEVAEALKAYYQLGCKRPCFNDFYLQAFNLPNGHLVDVSDVNNESAPRFTENAIVFDGKTYEVDCVIFGTGFNTDPNYARREGYRIVGRENVVLSDKWKDRPKTLYGLQNHGFPNLFHMGIIQGGYAANVTYMLEEQAHHIGYIIGEAVKRDLTLLDVTEEAENTWCEEMDSKAATGRFNALLEVCTPGYYNADGEASRSNHKGFFSGVYGGAAVEFYDLLQKWRDEGALRGLQTA